MSPKLDLHTGDVLEWCREYDGEPFHALLCDPPYELSFMGNKWDSTGIVFRPDTWAALAEHLYPGAFLFAFCGSRGWHRQAVAMEDAGLIMHPSLFGWGFGSGFPKATRVPDERFAGHRYGAQAMKPALEPILLFQKPYSGRPVDCITSTGAGALNVDAGRIGSAAVRTNGGKKFPALYGTYADCPESVHSGRWPANLLLDEHGAAILDAQSGITKSATRTGRRSGKSDGRFGEFQGQEGVEMGHSDKGGSSRFFFRSNWNAEVAEGLECADGLFYCAKAGRGERDAGLENHPQALRNMIESNPDFLTGSGKPQADSLSANTHPTIKPLRLTRYLASLLLPPDAYAPRRILVPFAGVGSECIGAALAGWEQIVGIEQSAQYCAIARWRFDWWNGNTGLFESLTQEDEPEPQQFDLFA